MRRSLLVRLLLVLALAGFSGCAGGVERLAFDGGGGAVDSGGTPGDGAVGDSGGVSGDSGGSGDSAGVSGDSGGALSCSGDCKDYVLDRVLIPASAGACGVKLAGTTHNTFFQIVSIVDTYLSAGQLQQDLDEALYQGDVVALLRLRAKDWQNDAAVRGQAWAGKSASCCSSSDFSTCRSQALQNCFNGQSAFWPHPQSPNNMLFSGSLGAGTLNLGPGSFSLQFAVKGFGSVTLDLKHVTLTGSLSGARIQNGCLAGAVPQSEIEKKLLPELAKLADAEYKDPSTSASTKNLLKSLLDSNGDGSITAAELKQNSLVQPLIGGDVDVDGDGKKELSLGLGYTAVTCQIMN